MNKGRKNGALHTWHDVEDEGVDRFEYEKLSHHFTTIQSEHDEDPAEKDQLLTFRINDTYHNLKSAKPIKLIYEQLESKHGYCNHFAVRGHVFLVPQTIKDYVLLPFIIVLVLIDQMLTLTHLGGYHTEADLCAETAELTWHPIEYAKKQRPSNMGWLGITCCGLIRTRTACVRYCSDLEVVPLSPASYLWSRLAHHPYLWIGWPLVLLIPYNIWILPLTYLTGIASLLVGIPYIGVLFGIYAPMIFATWCIITTLSLWAVLRYYVTAPWPAFLFIQPAIFLMPIVIFIGRVFRKH